jgi:hypothetical protein
MRISALMSVAGTALLGCAVALNACGDRTRHEVRLTYIKHDSSEQRMLHDKEDLLHTRGVRNALPAIDSSNTITLQLFLDERDDVPGRNEVLSLGYVQIRN